ncbi:MAG TPA: tetratricopeptide repeat protein, partial [Chthoniobacterales bacterium]|nr:tetratricopeptide repeat protein [Chthoniobacterales bacterium]
GLGNLEQSRNVLDSIENKNDIDYQGARLWLYLMERDCRGAKAFAANVPNEMKEGANFWFILATVAHMDGDVNEERKAYLEGKRLIQLALGTRPDDPVLWGDLALAEAGLGKHEEALRYARRACEMLPPSVDAVAGPALEMRLAEVLAVVGDRDGALDMLSKLANLPLSFINYGDLKFNPMWDDLRTDPRFHRILAESRRRLAATGGPMSPLSVRFANGQITP